MKAGSGRDSTDHECLNQELGRSLLFAWMGQVILDRLDLLGGPLESKTMESPLLPVRSEA